MTKCVCLCVCVLELQLATDIHVTWSPQWVISPSPVHTQMLESLDFSICLHQRSYIFGGRVCGIALGLELKAEHLLGKYSTT
jgi:hypothetical protein